jgi:integrase-like protein
VLRHTMATAMGEDGADIRVFQEISSHARLTTTQFYARVAIRLFKAAHTAIHPASKPSNPREALRGDTGPAILRTATVVSRFAG